MGHPGYCHHPDNITSYTDPEIYREPRAKKQIKGNPKKLNANNDCPRYEAGPNNYAKDTPRPNFVSDITG